MNLAARLLTCSAMISVAMAGDLTLTFQTKGKGIMGSATGTQVEYLSSRFMATKDEGTGMDTLVDYTQGITYTINHKKKTIGMMRFEDALAAMEQAKASMPKEMPAFMGKMLGGDPADVSVEKTSTEQIAGRTCQGYTLKVGKLVMELATDTKLQIPVPEATWTKSLRTRAAAFAAAGPMGASYKKLYEEMARIKGITLRSRFMGVERTALKVVEGPIPATVFALPQGYTTEDLGKKLREDMRR